MFKHLTLLLLALITILAFTSCNRGQSEYSKGMQAYDAEDYETALKHFSKAIDISPDLAHAYASRAHVLQEMNEQNKALVDYSKAL